MKFIAAISFATCLAWNPATPAKAVARYEVFAAATGKTLVATQKTNCAVMSRHTKVGVRVIFNDGTKSLTATNFVTTN
jgi:hypothetical protein